MKYWWVFEALILVWAVRELYKLNGEKKRRDAGQRD
jgi:hypothetical protein